MAASGFNQDVRYDQILESQVDPRFLKREQSVVLVSGSKPSVIRVASSARMNQQSVAQIPVKYIGFMCEKEDKQLDDKLGNSFDTSRFYNKSGEKVNKLAFYIPGTASSVQNPAIDDVIASHLVNTLGMPVILIAHRLAPANRWPIPFHDVCQAIEFFYEEFNKPEITITGYSSGGLYATLAMFVLHSKKIFVERLVLFSPLLDLSGDFYSWERRDHEAYRGHLPLSLCDQPDKLAQFKEDAQKDKVMTAKGFGEMIDNLFSEEYRNDIARRRCLSPVYRLVSSLMSMKEFPQVTIIIGENDFFRIEAEVFFGKLQDAKKISQLIVLEKEDHGVIWQRLYPIYLAQPVRSCQGKEIGIAADKLIEEDDCLAAIGEELQETRDLKAKRNQDKNAIMDFKNGQKKLFFDQSQKQTPVMKDLSYAVLCSFKCSSVFFGKSRMPSPDESRRQNKPESQGCEFKSGT